MKIFMLIKRLRYSGAYKMFMWLATTLANHDLDVTVMTFMPNDVETLPENIKWIKRDDLKDKNILSKIHAIRKTIKNENPDISISFLLDANVYNTIACLGLNTKSIICERNDPFKEKYYALWFWKPIFRFANGAIFQLPKVAEYYSNITSPTAIIPNPVSSENSIEIAPWNQREDKIVVLGRYDLFQKRHDVLISAFSIFVKSHPQCKLYFYGDGPDKSKMERQIRSLQLEQNIFLAGITNQAKDVLSTSKMYVLTSDFEGIPNSLIEAMSMGLPCISTDCRPGGAALLIQNGINGYIVPKGDYRAIAEKMQYIYDNPEAAELMGKKAKEISCTFSEEKITKLWLDYIYNL